MRKLLYLFVALSVAVGLNACSPDDDPENEPPMETPENPDNPNQPDNPTPNPNPGTGKTLIVYYNYTNNVHTIVSNLRTQIEAM